MPYGHARRKRVNEVKEEMKNIQQDRLNTDNIVIDKIVNFNPIQDLDNSSVQALSHIAGYLGRCALNRNNFVQAVKSSWLVGT